MRRRSDFRPYQELVVPRIKTNPKTLLAMDMGLGKTVITATAYSDLRDEGEVKTILIVAPKRVALHTWPDEYKAWSHLAHLKVQVISSKPKQREKAVRAPADVYVINRENFPWLCELFSKFPFRKINFPFDAILWDESSSLKDGRKKTGKDKISRFGWLAKVAPTVKRITLLSGTPASEGVEDLWGQCYILDGGAALGKFKSHFYDRWYVDRGRDFPLWEIRKGAREEILKLAEPLMQGLRSEDVLKLPERLDTEIFVDLPPDALRLYKDLKKHYVAQHQGSEVFAANAAVLVNKLAQVAAGAFYECEETDSFGIADGGPKVVTRVHDEKIQALHEIAEQGENLLVFYHYRHDLDRLKEAFPKARVLAEDQKAIDDWNAGRVPLLLAHPASAGHGLNLQFGGRVCVWFSLPWSLELYLQGCKRLHRSGQMGETVNVIHLLARGTVDEIILRTLRAKALDSDGIMDSASRSLQAEVLAAMLGVDVKDIPQAVLATPALPPPFSSRRRPAFLAPQVPQAVLATPALPPPFSSRRRPAFLGKN